MCNHGCGKKRNPPQVLSPVREALATVRRLTSETKYKSDITLDTFGVPMVLVEYKVKQSRTIIGPSSRQPLGEWRHGAIGLIPTQDYKRIRMLFNLVHDASILSEFGL